MDYVAGPVLHDAEVAATVPAAEDQPRRTCHRCAGGVAPNRPGCSGTRRFGPQKAYLRRQLKSLGKQWEATETHKVPAMDESTRLLAERMPEQIGASIVHGDYRLGNIIVGGGQVKAVLDWELCTLGDPLADVGYLLNSWIAPGEGDEDIAPTSAGGFCSRDELAALRKHNGS